MYAGAYLLISVTPCDSVLIVSTLWWLPELSAVWGRLLSQYFLAKVFSGDIIIKHKNKNCAERYLYLSLSICKWNISIEKFLVLVIFNYPKSCHLLIWKTVERSFYFLLGMDYLLLIYLHAFPVFLLLFFRGLWFWTHPLGVLRQKRHPLLGVWWSSSQVVTGGQNSRCRIPQRG